MSAWLNPGPWDFFISHRQAEGGRTAAVIAADLKEQGYKVWLDIYMKNISEEAMMQGVSNSKATIVLLSDTYFSSEICLKEARQAVASKKTIILVSVEGIDIGKALSRAPHDLAHIGKEAAIKAIISDVDFRELAIKKIILKKPSATPSPSTAAVTAQLSTVTISANAETTRKAIIEASEAAKRKHGASFTLYYAAKNGDEADVKALVTAGYGNLEEKDTNGNIPLILAAVGGHEGCVKALLAAGANKDAKNNDGETPLTFAANKGHEGCVKALLAAGANKDAKNNTGHTSLILAAYQGHGDVSGC